MSEAARRHCAQITRQQAANFYYGMRLLPADKRAALFAIYAFARRIDDIGDGELAVEEKRRLLDAAAALALRLARRRPRPRRPARGRADASRSRASRCWI